MSNSHEPSYYEIALTNRQVVVAFVVLLICLVSAFFSGMWLGRESAVRAEEQMARNAPPPAVTPQEGQNLEEFEFFDSGQQAGKAEAAEGARNRQVAAAAATPAPGSTLVDEMGGDQEPAVSDPDLPEGRRRHGRRGPQANAADVADEAGADDEAGASLPAGPATAPPATPATIATPARPAPTPAPAGRKGAPAAPATPEPRLAEGQVVIQVFSTPERDQAEKVRDRLIGGGYKAFLSPIEVAGRTMYRVRVGPFDSRDRAQQVAEQVRKGYKLDTWVTR